MDLLPEDFSLVTTYDNSTFCKPCPGYYREILKKLGKQAEQCRMVGNNPLDDMSAQALGLDVYFVTDHRKRKKSAHRPVSPGHFGGRAGLEPGSAGAVTALCFMPKRTVPT